MVRMGRTPKGWSSRSKKLKQDKRLSKHDKDPLKNSATLQIGRINPNMISTVYSSILLDLANQSAEQYASQKVYLQHKEDIENRPSSNEVEIDMTGDEMQQNDEDENKTKTQDDEIDWSHIDQNYHQKFHVFAQESTILEFHSQVLTSTSMEFSSITNTYKARANVVKFERLLDEQYGILRPILTHPKVEPHVKLLQRKWASGSISITRQGDAPLGKTASIVLLFMMYRNGIRRDGIALAALYLLVGLQPWVLLIAALVLFDLMERKKKKVIPGMASNSIPMITSYYSEDLENRNDFLKTPVGSPLTSGEESDLGQKYHSIVLGEGIDSLYCAALLARAGRKVLVLSPSADASGEITMSDKSQVDLHYNLKQSSSKEILDNLQKISNPSFTSEDSIPFTTTDAKLGHVHRNQSLLAPALATNTDGQGGIRFATIGSEIDGYAHDIFSIPGMGGSSSNDTSYNEDSPPFILRAGGREALAEDTALFLGDAWQFNATDLAASVAATYAKTVGDINVDAGPYYLSKLTKPNYQSWWDSHSKTSKNEYRVASVRYASDFLNHYIPLNPHVRSLCAGIGMFMEDLPPSKCSMAAHVTNIASFTSPEGFSFPVGGQRALGKALENVIVKNGGRVATDVSVKELVFDKVEVPKKVKEGDTPKIPEVGPKCKGVILTNNKTIHVTSLSSANSKNIIEGSIISTVGFLDTFLRLTPENVRAAAGVPPGLPALTERRPQIQLLLLLKGNREKLNLPSADWWRLPNASLPLDERNTETNQVTPGIVGELSSISTSNDENEPPHTQSKPVKFETGNSWMRISFPSAKDPSWEDRYPNQHTCVVTIEADDDLVQFFDTKPKVYIYKKCGEDVKKRLMARMLKDVLEQYPQLEGKIMKLSLTLPKRRGLSHTPQRYAAQGIRPQTKYPNLFLAGKDLTMDTFSGGIVGSWLAVNAVLGYNYLCLGMLNKNVTYDLKQFIQEAEYEGEEAVLYIPKKIIVDEKDIEELDDSGQDASAEASKES